MTEINAFERILVADDLEKRGIKQYTMQPGNKCVWVNYYSRNVFLNCYYLFRDGKIIDVIYD